MCVFVCVCVHLCVHTSVRMLVCVCVCVQAPDCCVVGSGEKILLFRHQAGSEQLLHRLTDQDALQDGDLIEIILSGKPRPGTDRKSVV